MKEHEQHDRRAWLIIFILILLGFLCMLLTSGWALRFAPNWRLDTSMESRLDPNSNFLNSRPDGYFEPLDPSILTQPAWINVFLTPGASFATRTPAPASTSVNATPIPSTPTAKPPTTPPPTNTSVVIVNPTRTSVVVPPTRTSTAGPAISIDLRITKSDGVATYIAGSPVTYTIVVSNNGPNNVIGAKVSDTKPSQVTTWQWVCTSQNNGASGCNPMSGNANFNNTVNLPVGASITYTVTANIAVNATGNLVNTATVSVPPGYTDPNTANNSATDTDTLPADLAITKTDGTGRYIAGGSVTYTITVTNSGPNNVTNATVTDTFSTNTNIASTTWTCSGTGTCTASGSGNINDNTVDLLVGQSVTYIVHVNISGTATGNLVNTASVSVPSGYTDPNTANNTATDTDAQASADLQITKTDTPPSGTYIPGNPITYTIVVSNNGPDNVTGATVTDTFLTPITSANWTCVGAGGGTCTASGSGNINSSNGGVVNLPVGASVTYSVTVNTSSSATADLSNTASVSTPVGITDPVAGNNSDTDIDTPALSANLSITKTDNAAYYAANETKTYTVAVSNAGPSDVTGATVTDATLTTADNANIASAIWTCSGTGGGTCTANGSGNISDSVNLPVGASVTYTITAKVVNAPSGDLVNEATVSSPISVTSSATDTDTLLATPGQIGSTPDGITYNLPENGYLTLALSSPVVANGDIGAWDLVYYELPAFPIGIGINLDLVQIEISSDGVNWIPIFNWGDNIIDTNTNLTVYLQNNPQVPEETEERPIPASTLYSSSGYPTGIAIDVDPIVPPGTYPFIRFYAPPDGNDGVAEIDGIEILTP